MKYKKYPNYKDSGVEWLGELPDSWSTNSLGINFSISGRIGWKNLRSDEYVDKSDYIFLATPNLKDKYIDFENVNYITKERYDESPEIKLDIEDILLVKSGSTLGIVNIVRNLPKASTINGSSVVLRKRINNTYPYYYYYLLKSSYFQNIMKITQSGVGVPSVNQSDIRKIILPMPLLLEQQQIANFLDNATAKIDTLIEKQTKLIEILKEKRQAVISHAVTKGINPDAKMKDSGVEWLGEIPEHWEVPKIKYIASTDSGGTPTSSKRDEYYNNGTYPWIRTTDLNNSELFDTPIKITQKALADTACNIIKKGSVLIGMYGGAGTIGKHSLLRFSATINQAVCSITPTNNIISEYLHYFIQFYRPYWMIGAMGTRKDPNIGQDTINNRHIINPPLEEQQQIVNYLDDKTSKMDKLIEKANKSIELLKEKRTALISAAVTGKIDVREIV